MAHSIRTRVGEVFLDANRFVVVRYNEIAEIGMKDLVEIENAVFSLTDGRDAYVLAILGKYSVTTNEARHYLQKAKTPCTLAQAVVVHSVAQRVIGNFYARFKQKEFPVRMFGSRNDATNWLLELKKRELVLEAVPA